MADPGEGARGVRPPYFWRPPLPTPPPPLIWRFGSATDPVVSCTAPLIPSHWFPFKGMLARQTIRFSIFLVLGDMLINDGILALRQHCNVGTSVYGWMLQGHTYKTVNAELPHLCVFVCRKDDRCQSFNFVMPHQRCEFNKTALVKPSLEISSQVLTDYTSREALVEVSLNYCFSIDMVNTKQEYINGLSNLPFSAGFIFSVYV